ncbi:MAG TPA: CAP domain-containing protein [Mucilaginibacter sp.]|nr:CAP domain-containing protein [Mucilaginibacter sp.]
MKLLIMILAGLFLLPAATIKPIEPQSRKFKEEFLDRINKARHQGCNCGTVYMPPAPPLKWNDELADAAINHAEDMSSKNYFSHTSKDGRTVTDRIMAAGYTFKGYKSFAAGENIAEGQMSIAEVMDGWLHSPGHCKNLMNPSFKEVGVAQFNKYWVQDFGGRVPFSAREEKMIKSGRYRVIQTQSPGH